MDFHIASSRLRKQKSNFASAKTDFLCTDYGDIYGYHKPIKEVIFRTLDVVCG